jgi:hypothetical protein
MRRLLFVIALGMLGWLGTTTAASAAPPTDDNAARVQLAEFWCC